MKEKVKRLIAVLKDKIESRFNGLNFEEEIIDSDRMKITLKYKNFQIQYSASFHHLDTPWQITSKVNRSGQVVESIELFCGKRGKSNEPRYEVYPILLENRNEEMEALADLICQDLDEYTTNMISHKS